MKKVGFLYFILLCVQFASFNAKAYESDLDSSLNSHIFRFSQSLETISMENSLSPESDFIRSGKRFLLRFSYDHTNDSVLALTHDRDDRILEYNDNIQTYMFGFSYLIKPNILLGVSLPLHSVKTSPSLALIKDTSTRRKRILGDMRLEAKIGLGEKWGWHWSVIPRIFFPMGIRAKDYLLTDQSFGLGGLVAVDRTFGRFKLYGNLGYSYAYSAQWLSIDRRSRFEGAVGVRFRVLPQFYLNTEWLGELSTKFDKDENPMSWLFGGYYQIYKNPSSPRIYASVGYDQIFRSSRSHGFNFNVGAKWAFDWRKKARSGRPHRVKSSQTKRTSTKRVATTKRKAPAKVYKKTVAQKVLLRETVRFGNATSQISTPDRAKINRLLQQVHRSNPQKIMVVVEGHTSTPGEYKANQKLSLKRAHNVARYLQSRIRKDLRGKLRFVIIGRGESRPLIRPDVGFKSKAENLRRQRINRRVELKIVAR